MYTEWEETFDTLCGASLHDTLTEPLVDSSIHDWVHGLSGAHPADNESPALDGAIEDESENLCTLRRETYLII